MGFVVWLLTGQKVISLSGLNFVDYNGHYLSSRCISCGVPQGSILGPLFFSVIHLMIFVTFVTS